MSQLARHTTAKSLVALLGTIPLALAISVALSLALPLPRAWRVTAGAYLVLPVWVIAACWSFLARDARRAACGVLSALAAAVAIAAAVSFRH
jgi:hypothetical protein